jgi:hypothetical protein
LDRAIIFHVVRKDDVTAPIANRLDPSIRAPKSVLVGELDALDASPVDVGKSEQMSGEMAVWVVAASLGHQLDTRDVELSNARGFVGRHLTFDPDEIAVRREALRQPLVIDVENFRNPPRNGLRVLLHCLEAAGIGVDTVDVCTHGELRPVPVVDRTPSRRNPKVAEVLILGHFPQTIAGRDLNVKRPNDHEQRHRHHARPEQRDPSSKPSLPPVSHRTLPAAARLCFSFIVTMRVGFGISMPSVPRAIVSTRPLCRSVAASMDSKRRS